MEKLDNYDKLISEPDKWDIDKDIKCEDGEKIYSPDTLIIISKKENSRYGQKDKMVSVDMYDGDFQLLGTFTSKTNAYTATKIPDYLISHAIKTGDLAGGFYWREHNEVLLH